MIVDINEKYYGSRLALSNIHLVFNRGESTLIIGTSGAGKSTLIKSIIGKTKYQGFIRDYRPEDIGYIPQFPALNVMETSQDALYWSALFSSKYRSRKICRQMAGYYIDMMGLSGEKDHQIKSLSGGQKQRVSIAKELIRMKGILIADEIDTGLDAGVSRGLIGTLIRITRAENKTTVIISHNLSNIEMYDRVVVLVRDSGKTGRIAYSGRPQNMKRFFDTDDYVDILVKLNSVEENGLGQADYYIGKYEAFRKAGQIL